jgi:hypothetical protein
MGGTMTAEKMTPVMRDVLSAAEGSSDLWLPAHGPSHSTVNTMAEFGWVVATLKGDRVYIGQEPLVQSGKLGAPPTNCRTSRPTSCRANSTMRAI